MVKTAKEILSEIQTLVTNLNNVYFQNKLSKEFLEKIRMLTIIKNENILSDIQFQNNSEKNIIISLYNSLGNIINSIKKENFKQEFIINTVTVNKRYILNLKLENKKNKSFGKKILNLFN